jgi:hypothetical protein
MSNFDEVNDSLSENLDKNILTPESGIQRIRSILYNHRLDMPVIYGLNPDDDEFVLSAKKIETEEVAGLVYVIYGKTDDGYYEFYAEMGNSERIEELLSDGEDTEET